MNEGLIAVGLVAVVALFLAVLANRGTAEHGEHLYELYQKVDDLSRANDRLTESVAVLAAHLGDVDRSSRARLDNLSGRVRRGEEARDVILVPAEN